VTRIIVEAISAFVISAGTTLIGYMVGKEAVVMPSAAAALVAAVTGLVAAANQVRAYLSPTTP